MKTEYFCRAMLAADMLILVAVGSNVATPSTWKFCVDGGVESGGDRTDGGRRVPWTLTLSSELYVCICRIPNFKTKKRR